MTIPEIKDRLPIGQVLRHYGITINRNGHIQCPFHDDKKASMKVYLETNTAFCFAGSCPTHEHSVDVIDFIMYMEKCSKHCCQTWLELFEFGVGLQLRTIALWKRPGIY